MDGSTRSRLQDGASSAITPSGNGSSKRSASTANLAPPPGSASHTRPVSPSFPNPVTRTQSACFPVTKNPSCAGLAMIKTTERTPPPTNLSFDEALALLHKMEKQLTIDVKRDIEELRFRMTSSKIELVSRKTARLYTMRVLLNMTRRLCREEGDVMEDFGGVKSVIDTSPRGQIDEDDYMATKDKLLVLGGRLTDIRRKQQKLASQVEDLQGAVRELVDPSRLDDLDGYEFNMESFKKESSALPEMPKLCQTLPSYDLFNCAPFNVRDRRPSSAMSGMSGDSDRPFSASPVPPGLSEEKYRSHRKVKVYCQETTTSADVSDDEGTGGAYFPQRSGVKKKKSDFSTQRRHAPSETSDTEGEDCYQVFTNKLTPMEAQPKTEEERLRDAEEEARIEREVEEQIKREEEEDARKQEELAKKKKEDDEKKKAVMEAKQKAAAEKASELEAKRKAVEDKKTAEADAKRKVEQGKKKAELDAKKKVEDEAKKKKEEVDAKKKAVVDAKKQETEDKKKAEQEAKKQREEEEKAKRLAEEEFKKAELDAKKKAAEEEARRQEDKEQRYQEELQRQEEEQRYQEELQRQEEERQLKVQASMEKERKERKTSAGSGKGIEEEEMLFDEKHQISNKEDLFAAISDTSLRAGKQTRQRRKLPIDQEYEDSEEEVPTKKQSYKSRTASRERPKSQLSAKEEAAQEIDEPSHTRTASKERPKSGQQQRVATELEEDMEIEELMSSTTKGGTSRTASRQAQKSRTSSRERPGSSGTGVDHYIANDSEDIYAVARPKSRGSRPASGDYSDLAGQAKLQGSRPPSRYSNSEFMTDNVEPELQWDEEMDEEDESLPSLAPMSGAKSRTSSRERPASRLSGQRSRPGSSIAVQENFGTETTSIAQSMPRPGSRTLQQEEELLRIAGEQEAAAKEYDKDMEKRAAKSRTSSRERLKQQSSFERRQEEQPEEPVSSRRAGAKSRTSSRERPGVASIGLVQAEEFEPVTSRSRTGPRTSSRERLKQQSSFERRQEEQPEEPVSSRRAGAKSRTASRERPGLSTALIQAEECEPVTSIRRTGAKSRTSSNERPPGASTTGPLQAEEYEQPVAGGRRSGAQSRTSSRERPGVSSGLTPKSSFGEADMKRGAQSRTASRERPASRNLQVFDERDPRSSREHLRDGADPPMWPEDESDNEARALVSARSRTSSADRRQMVGGDRGALLAEDQGYDTLPGVRSYREEMELDTRQYERQYESGTMDSGVPESYHSATDHFVDDEEEDEPPPAEPIYNRQIHNERAAAPPRPSYEMAQDQYENIPADETRNFNQATNGYGYDEEQYASELDHEDEKDESYFRSNKKVSFAETNEQFLLKPDPDVKVIPGTKLFCFAPSSTHEQVTEESVLPSDTSLVTALEGDILGAEALPPKQPSTSPKAFLKAMAKGMKGEPRPSRDNERRGSLMDNILRRGRDTSATGSRNSSRQSSLDGAKPGGSNQSDYSTGSAGNYDEMSEAGSDHSFFKKMKTKKVNTVDFDQLFARGHAISAQNEQGNVHVHNGLHIDVTGPQIQPTAGGSTSPGTPFEVYSKDEAFKKSQQGAGISYAEKVQSYLSDQQTNQGYPFGTQAANQATVTASPDQIDAPTRMQSRKSPMYESAPSSLSVQPSTQGGRQSSKSPIPPPQRGDKFTAAKSVSPVPLRAKKQMTPQEFLSRIQDFVQKAEMDVQYSQPVWPAIVQSPSDMPPTKPLQQAYFPSPSFSAPSPQAQPILTINAPTSPRKNSASLIPQPENALTQRQRSAPGYGPPPREHSPFKPDPSIFDSSMRSPMSHQALDPPNSSPYSLQTDNLPPSHRRSSPMPTSARTASPYDRPASPYDRPVSPYKPAVVPQRIAPSPGKSYLDDKPLSLSPDPFVTSVELDPSEAPPSARTAIEASSSIIDNLRRKTSHQNKQESEIDDIITLDLRHNQEKLEYKSMPSDYRNRDTMANADRIPIPSPRRGASPRLSRQEQQTVGRAPTIQDSDLFKKLQATIGSLHCLAADRHMPDQLRPDPLTAHETVSRQPTNLRLAGQPDDDNDVPTIQDTDLYKKLSIGIDRLMQSGNFKDGIGKSNGDFQSYSSHLGRAEFGVLKKRTTSFQGISNPMAGGGRGQQQSRDPSNERPASAMAKIGGKRSQMSSQQHSRDSSLGRHSRVSSNSNIPDLETQEFGFGLRTSGGSASGGSAFGRLHGSDYTVNIEPHPEVVEKKKEVLQELAVQKQAVKEAKVWVQLLLLFVLCLCVLVFLQNEG